MSLIRVASVCIILSDVSHFGEIHKAISYCNKIKVDCCGHMGALVNFVIRNEAGEESEHEQCGIAVIATKISDNCILT